MLKGLIRKEAGEHLETLSPEARDEVVRALREYDRKREQDPLSLYFPHSRQHIFHSFRSPVRVFLAGTQSGKTTAGLADDLIQALPEEDLPSHLREYKCFQPPFEVRIMAPSAQVLETVTYSKLRELIPTHTYLGGTWSKAFDSLTRTLHLACGSKLYFMCFRGDQRALMPDGTWRSVASLEVDDEVQTRYGPRRVLRTVSYPDAPMIRLRARGGFELVSTPNHPHMTKRGWVRTDEIRLGDELVEYQPIRGGLLDPNEQTMEDWEVGWAAVLIGDGCMTAGQPMFTAAEGAPLLSELPPLPEGMSVRYQKNTGGRCPTFFLTTGKNGHGNPIKKAMTDLGLWGKKAPQKFIPDEIFRQPFAARCAFLRWLWGCDGTITARSRSATYATTSRRLAFDVKYLLRSVGLYTTITTITNAAGGFRKREGVSYGVHLSGSQYGTFNELVGKAGIPKIAAKNGTPKHARGTVFSIEETDPGDVFCVEVEEVHELVVDGVVTSNTYEQDVGKMGGASIDRVHYDEQPPEPARNECRWRVAAKSGDEIFTMTPMEGLSWTYDAFGIEEGIEVASGVHRFGDVSVVRADIDDNPALGEKEKARALHGLSDAERAARKEGRFVALHGLIYEEFRSERHVIPAIEELPKNVNTVVGIDPGMGVAAGVVWAYLGVNDQLVVFDEHKPEGATVADVAKAIHTINAHYNVKPLYYVIDPIARNKNHQTGRSDQMEYADHGIVSIAGQNAVRPGLNRIKERLRAEDADEDPKLVITANCTALIKEIKRYRWKQPPRSGEDSTEKPVKKDDHLLDALRYLVMSRPYLPEPYSENTETELEKMVREDQARGDNQDLDHEFGGGVFC